MAKVDEMYQAIMQQLDSEKDKARGASSKHDQELRDLHARLLEREAELGRLQSAEAMWKSRNDELYKQVSAAATAWHGQA